MLLLPPPSLMLLPMPKQHDSLQKPAQQLPRLMRWRALHVTTCRRLKLCRETRLGEFTC
jgi:hypothetical protein